MPRKVVRFIQLGPGLDTILGNLTRLLNRIQLSYRFELDDKVVAVGPGPLKDTELKVLVAERMKDREGEYAIGVTGTQIVDDLLSISGHQRAIVSTWNWGRWSKISLTRGLEYMVGGLLLDARLAFDAHDDTQGCPNDYCADRKDIDLGIVRGQFCKRCEQDIEKELNRGQIGLAEVVAVRRILHDAAGRKLCCVLMPFAKRFVPVFASIATVVQELGWECTRADSLFQTGPVMRGIEQMIGCADLVVADLTGRNPNVFFELGYAHAFGKLTVLLTQRVKDVPFDLRHQHFLLYTKKNLGSQLKTRLGSLI